MNIFTDSCSHFSTLAQIQKKYNGGGGNGLSVGGAFALGAASQGLQTSSSSAIRNIPTYNKYFFGARFKLISTSNGSFNDLVRFLDNGNNCMNLGWNTGGTLFARRAGTTVATSSLTVALNTVHLIEIVLVVDASSGVFQVYIDNVLYINFAGNTKGSTNSSVNALCIGDPNQFKVVQWSDIYLNDDTGAVCNGRFGTWSITPKKVASAGAFAQFSRGGVDTGSNQGQLNKLLADAASFNKDNVLNHRDSFNMDAVASGTILGARSWAYAQKEGSGLRSLALSLKNSVDDLSANIPLSSGGYDFYTRDASLDPSTTALWASLAALNGTESGYKITV